jgi:hypothetical protein
VKRSQPKTIWRDYAKLGERQDQALIDDTIAFIEARDGKELAAFFSVGPGSPTNPDMFPEEEENELIEAIVYDLRPPKRRIKGRRPDAARGAAWVRHFFGRHDKAAVAFSDKLEKRLGQKHAGTRARSTYTKVVFRALHALAKDIKSEWTKAGVKYQNMPRPHEAALAYFLKVRGVPSDKRQFVFDVMLPELESFISRPR